MLNEVICYELKRADKQITTILMEGDYWHYQLSLLFLMKWQLYFHSLACNVGEEYLMLFKMTNAIQCVMFHICSYHWSQLYFVSFLRLLWCRSGYQCPLYGKSNCKLWVQCTETWQCNLNTYILISRVPRKLAMNVTGWFLPQAAHLLCPVSSVWNIGLSPLCLPGELFFIPQKTVPFPALFPGLPLEFSFCIP